MKKRIGSIFAAAIFVAVLGMTAQGLEIPERVATDGAGASMDTFLTRLELFGFNGSVLVAQGDRILLHNAYGVAAVARGIPNSTRTVFSTGSVTKQFTAAGILKLEMAGKLATTDSIGKFFDSVPPDKAGITIHQLLTHTSGLRMEFGPDRESIDRKSFVRRTMAMPLESAPGEQYQYSNAGYSLLAAIIEIASGQEYEAYLRDALFLPSGMEHTGLKLLQVSGLLIARSHNPQLGYMTPFDRPEEYWNLKGSGGILSTPADMYRWLVALRTDKVLSPEAREKMFTKYVREYPDGPPSYYGYGWAIQPYGGHKTLIWHNGGAMPQGWGCAVYQFVDDSADFIVFTNKTIDGELPSDAIVDNLSAILFGSPVAMPPPRKPIRRSVFDDYMGTFALPEGGRVAIGFDSRYLRLSAEGQEAMDIMFPSPFPERLPKYNQWTTELIEAMAAGDFDKAGSYFEVRSPGDDLAGMCQEWWQSFDSLGAFVSVEPLGSMLGGGARSYGRAKFENGTVDCVFFWMGGKCGGMQSEAPLPSRVLLPQSESELAGYSLYRGELIKASFESPDALLLTFGNREVHAERVE